MMVNAPYFKLDSAKPKHPDEIRYDRGEHGF